MAFHTRRVKIKALNDSKEIAVIIYINSITLSLLAFVEFALTDYHEVYAALFGLALLVGATLFLTLLFIPKVASFLSCSMQHYVTVDIDQRPIIKIPEGAWKSNRRPLIIIT